MDLSSATAYLGQMLDDTEMGRKQCHPSVMPLSENYTDLGGSNIRMEVVCVCVCVNDACRLCLRVVKYSITESWNVTDERSLETFLSSVPQPWALLYCWSAAPTITSQLTNGQR